MTNEQLAHELLLDPTFQLDESGGCSVENPVFHRIRESFHKTFWESLVDKLSNDNLLQPNRADPVLRARAPCAGGDLRQQ